VRGARQNGDVNTKSFNQGASGEVGTGGNWASPRPRARAAGCVVSAWKVAKIIALGLLATTMQPAAVLLAH